MAAEVGQLTSRQPRASQREPREPRKGRGDCRRALRITRVLRRDQNENRRPSWICRSGYCVRDAGDLPEVPDVMLPVRVGVDRVVEDVAGLRAGTRAAASRRSGTTGTARSRGSSRQGRRTGCGRCCRSERRSAARTRVVSNHVPAAPMLPVIVEVPTRSAVCWLLGVFSDVPLAVTVNGLPLNAANTPLTCQSLMIALHDVVVAALASATAAHTRSPSGSCAGGRSRRAPSCGTARSACSRSASRGRRCRSGSSTC